MPIRSALLCLVLSVPPMYLGWGVVGCKAENLPSRPVAPITEATQGNRAQKFAPALHGNPFVGDWVPISAYVANNWVVRFTADGRMSVEGPGLVARGFYSVHGSVAQVNYQSRDGLEPTSARMAQASYSISPNGELSFSTGIEGDPPVHLRQGFVQTQ